MNKLSTTNWGNAEPDRTIAGFGVRLCNHPRRASRNINPLDDDSEVKMREIEPGIFVAGQIALADIAELARAGISRIVNNRPDGEELGQPPSAAIEAAARAAGIAYDHVPVAGAFPADAVDAVRACLAQGHAPVLLFCRSGMRSAALWALAMAGEGADADALIEAAGAAGQDLRMLRPLLVRAKPSE